MRPAQTQDAPWSLAGKVDAAEALRLAHAHLQSLAFGAAKQAAFLARLNSGGVFLDGLRCRWTFSPPGVLRVFVEATGEQLAESAPGALLTPKGCVAEPAAMADRTAKTAAREIDACIEFIGRAQLAAVELAGAANAGGGAGADSPQLDFEELLWELCAAAQHARVALQAMGGAPTQRGPSRVGGSASLASLQSSARGRRNSFKRLPNE